MCVCMFVMCLRILMLPYIGRQSEGTLKVASLSTTWVWGASSGPDSRPPSQEVRSHLHQGE